MISFGKRLLALLCATLLFAIYYMFLGIIDDRYDVRFILAVESLLMA